jgi:biotin operon repressor
MMFDRYEDDYVSVDECARRLRLTRQRVMELIEARVLKAHWDGYLLVQPALIAGKTTGVGACG